MRNDDYAKCDLTKRVYPLYMTRKCEHDALLTMYGRKGKLRVCMDICKMCPYHEWVNTNGIHALACKFVKGCEAKWVYQPRTSC